MAMSPLSNTNITPKNVKKTPNPVKPSPISAQKHHHNFQRHDFENYAQLSNRYIMNKHNRTHDRTITKKQMKTK